mgnify:CR=1 FL=1
MTTELAKQDKVQMILKGLILIGGLNWGLTAYKLRPTDEIRDVVFLLHTQMKLNTLKLQDLQRGVYASVAIATAAWFASNAKASADK